MSPASRTAYAKYVRGSLRMRLLLTFGLGSIVLFLLIRVISFTGIPWIDFAGERDTFIRAAEQNLQATADEKKETLQQWFQERLGDGRTVVSFPGFRQHALELSNLVRQQKETPVNRMQRFLAASEHYRQILERIRILYSNYAQYDGIELVDLRSGVRMVSNDEADIGSIAPYANELRGEEGAAWSEKIFFSRNGEKAKAFLYMAFAVRNADEKPVAALVFRIEPETFLLHVLHESAVLGRSGEIILIDMQKMLLTPLKHRLPDGTTAEPLTYILRTKPAEVASLGVEALFTSHDYRGIPILVAVRHARIIPDFGLGLIVKRDEQEVFEPVRQSLIITTGVTGLGLIILLGLVVFAAGTIARPIEGLTEAAKRITGGDLGARAPLSGTDEVLLLAHAFNDMAGRIQQSQETLEQQVAERTEELTAANQLLRVEMEERRHIEAQLVQAQKMESVGRLAGGVAHDFNNMLAIIFISLELARMNLQENDPVREHLDDIEKAAAHSRDITRQLLAFSRQQMISPRLCNLNTLIADLEKSLGRLIGEDIELRFYPDPELGAILIDPSQIDQVLVNLAVNARDAMPHGGKLTIATANISFDEAYCGEHPEARPGRYVKLSVSDEGVGMDKETLAHIFEPFFTTKEVGKGTGLGLATIYGVVKQNGGFVNVYSEAGQGTSFKLYFPRADAAEHPVETYEAKEPAKGEAHILLVEDDEMLCRVTQATLETLGYTVTAAHSPAEALALFEKEPPHFALLLTDVVMPGMNGRELAERIALKRPGIKVVFMSGYTSDAVVHRGVLDDGVQFIQKPFSIHSLAGKVWEAMQS